MFADMRDGYSYSDDLPDQQKLHLSQQTISALGTGDPETFRQILTVQGPIEVLRQTYSARLENIGQSNACFRGARFKNPTRARFRRKPCFVIDPANDN